MSESLFPVVGEPSEAFTGPTAWPEVSSEPPDDGDLPTIALGPQANDITGKKFGRLTALRPVERYKHGEHSTIIVWLCQCSCGQYVKACVAALVSKNTKSCGCLRKDKSSQRFFKDLRGKRFGRLTVLSQNGKTKSGKTRWLCQCSCGKQTTKTAGDLVSKRIKSCGCWHDESAYIRACERTGPKNPNWDPQLTDEYRTKRRLGLSKILRQIYIRDRAKCNCCGCPVRKQGHVHHMEPWSRHKELRFDRDNLILLCSRCHKAYHRSFPAKIANSDNFVEWFKARKVSLSCQSSSPGRSR